MILAGIQPHSKPESIDHGDLWFYRLTPSAIVDLQRVLSCSCKFSYRLSICYDQDADKLSSFGKVYTVFPIKTVFIFGLVVFEAGSLLCTLAPNSAAFIVGRAIAGVGCGAFSGGLLKLLRHCFPLRKQALMVGLAGGCQSVGLVIAPVLGGIMIDRVSWRLCFGINIPFGVLCIVLTAYGFHDPVPNPDTSLPLKEKVKRLNMIDTVFVVPAITCLLLALQWGGVTYGWGNVRIIVLLILFAILFSGFGYLQYRRGEDATVPLRVIKQRSIMGAMWYNACCNGVLATTEYYISIYYQGVRGFSATKSGLLGIPMIIGFSVAMMAAAAGTTMIGYYFRQSTLYAISDLILTSKISFHDCYEHSRPGCFWPSHNHRSRYERRGDRSLTRICGRCHWTKYPKSILGRSDRPTDQRCVAWWCHHRIWRWHGLRSLDLRISYTISESAGRRSQKILTSDE